MNVESNSISVVDLVTNESHCLNSDYIIGRGWLKCDDKRISRNHGVLKVLGRNSVALISTHENPMFYRKENITQINKIEKNNEVHLTVGDSFGLLVDKFWFLIQFPVDNNITNIQNGIESGTKRQTSTVSESNSSSKRFKNDSNGYEAQTMCTSSNSIHNQNSNNGTNVQMPSTSTLISDQNDHSMGPAHYPIKLERVEMDDTETNLIPPTKIKTEPEEMIENTAIDTNHLPIKTEIKNEPRNDETVLPIQQNESAQQNQPTTLRECCRYGIRCYRRNPVHRTEEAHPGDSDYTLPQYPDPPLGVPPCPFLDRCYRRNPVHFQQFTHKTQLKSKEGYEATAKPPKQTTNCAQQQNHVDEDDNDTDDPYATDNDSDPDFADPGSASESDEIDELDTNTSPKNDSNI